MKKEVLIVGFGAPSPDEEGIKNFLRRLWDKDVPEILVKNVLRKYKIAKPPSFLEKVKGLAKSLAELTSLPVSYAFLVTPPFVSSFSPESEWLILPLSPVYSDWFDDLLKKQVSGKYRVVENWGLEEGYIDICAESIKGSESVLFTFHSLPPSEEKYRTGSFTLAEKIAQRAGVKNWAVAFQSGREEWLQPTLEKVVDKMKKNTVVFPAGFVFECLETRYDLDIVFKELLMKKGFEYRRIKCAGESKRFVEFLSKLVLQRSEE